MSVRIKPVYNWTVDKSPADALVTKQEKAARKAIVVRGKAGKKYKVSTEPRTTGHSSMAAVVGCTKGSSKRTKEEAETLLCMALNKLG